MNKWYLYYIFIVLYLSKLLSSITRLLLRSTKPLLQSRNASVVMATAQLYWHLAPKPEVEKNPSTSPLKKNIFLTTPLQELNRIYMWRFATVLHTATICILFVRSRLFPKLWFVFSVHTTRFKQSCFTLLHLWLLRYLKTYILKAGRVKCYRKGRREMVQLIWKEN